jgi:predicted transcriptional regulator
MFLEEKPAVMLVQVRKSNEPYASSLSTACDTTYSHTVKILNKMEDRGYISSDKRGRKKVYKLTVEGELLAEKLEDVIRELELQLPSQSGRPTNGGIRNIEYDGK